MDRLTRWDLLQVLGSLASVVSLLLFFWNASERARLILAAILTLAVVSVVVASIMARQAPLRPITREEMIELGRRLILSTRHDLIMFGGDMSWADDYEAVITQVAKSGKVVRVLHPSTDAAMVNANADRIRRTGAEVLATAHDSGLRAMLIDPFDPDDAKLYVIKRSVSTDIDSIAKRHTTTYAAKVYDMRRDALLIRTTCRIYQILTESVV